MASRAYEMAFKLNAKLGNSYSSTFAKAENVAKKAFSGIAKMGAAVMGGIGIADIANTYKDFQQSMANTGAIAGVSKSSEGFKALENAALEAGRTTSKTAKEAADALGYMSLAGWTTEQSISGLMPVLRLSEASGADLATTSDLVTDSMSAMGIATSDLSKYLDIAANANNKTNQTATQMLETFIGAGGMFKELGTSMEEAAALSGVLANRGIKGSEGATSLNSILINLMGNSKSSAEALEKLGVSAYDSNGKFRGVTTTLKDISAAMKNASDEDRGWFLSKLGGKTQIDTLNALLSGIETLGENGKSEVENLTAAFKESGGALEEMSKRMNDTFSGALAILGSATDDVKIQIMKELEPTITPIIRKIADALPGLGTKIAGFFKSMVRKGKALWNDLKPVFSWIVENFDNIKVGIAAMGGAFAGAKIVDKIKNIANAVKGFASACKANPILLVVEAVAALGFAAYEAHEQMKKANLEEHFGNISLSAEQLQSVAEHILGSKSFDKIGEALNIKKNLENTESTLQGYIDSINSMNFKVEMGMELSIDEKEQYKQDIENYISTVNNYANEQWRSDLMLFDGNITMTNALNTFYNNNIGELEATAKELRDAMTAAFNDGLLEPQEAKIIAEIQGKMADIQAKMAISDSYGQMKALAQEKLKGGLTKESFRELINEMNTIADENKEGLTEAYGKQLSRINIMYEEGILTENAREAEETKVYEDYRKNVYNMYENAAKFLNDTIYSKYGDSIQKGYDEYVNNPENYREVGAGRVKVGDDVEIYTEAGRTLEITDYSIKGVSLTEKNAIEDLTDLGKDFFKNLQEYSSEYSPSGEILRYYKARAVSNSADRDARAYTFKEGPLSYIGKSTYYKYEEGEPHYNIDGTRNRPSKVFSEAPGTKEVSEQRYKDFMGNMEKNNMERKLIIGPIDYVAKERISSNEKFINTFIKDFKEKLTAKTNKQEIKTTVTANAVTKAGVIDTTDFSRGVHNAASTPIETDVRTNVNIKAGNINTSGFVNQVHNTVNSLFSGIGVKVRVGADGKIEKFAKGTEYTPDTFIAGEKGAELITGAKGRKVFTALETSNIFSNIGRIKDMLLSAVGTVNIFDRIKGYDISEISGENEGMLQERIVKPSNTTNNNSNISITINNEIKIDAKDSKSNDNLKALIDEAMEENSKKIADLIRGIIEDNNVREMRLSNG